MIAVWRKRIGKGGYQCLPANKFHTQWRHFCVCVSEGVERLMDVMELKQTACAAIDSAAEQLIAFGEDIGCHPELGYREQRTGGRVLEAFRALGLQDITRPACTGVKGWLPTGGKAASVAVIGELDAVLSPLHPQADPSSGAAHACGHNAQLSAMLGAAIGLKTVAGYLGGKVCFMATPAEEYVEIGWRESLREHGELEYLGGKQQLIAEGAFNDIDMALMVHSETEVEGAHIVVGGSAGGFIGKEVRFIGKEAHAGGAPWQGVNALNAATLAIQAIHAQRETFRDTDNVRVHPILTKGGDLVNTVPADVRMESYVRAATIEAMQSANAKVDRAIRGASYAIGAKAQICNLPGYLPLRQNKALSALFAENTCTLMPDAQLEEGLPFCGSTDMGDLSYLLPVIQPTVSGFTGAAHSKDFRITDPQLAYIIPAKLLTMAVIDLLACGAERALLVKADAPRHSPEDHRRLWQNILQGFQEQEL